MGSDTLRMRDVVFTQLEKEDDLINNTSAIDLFRGIEKIRPLFYYNRMICKLFDESEFAKRVGENYDYPTNKTITGYRNDLITDAIKNNIRPYATLKDDGKIKIELTPKFVFEDVYDALTRVDRGFSRGKIFLAALAFNLEFTQFEELLTHCLGERKVDFKNPYEVIFSYCLCKHEKPCEEYLRIKDIYEKTADEHERKADYKNTLSFEEDFWDVKDEEDLFNLLYSLPENDSTSAPAVFKENYDTVMKELTDIKILDKIADETSDFHEITMALNKLHNDSALYKKIFELNEVTTEQVVNEFAGKVYKDKADTFNFIRGKMFSKDTAAKILQGKRYPTKEELLLIIFFNYCITGARDRKLSEMYEDDNLVKEIFCHFELYASGELSEAGFDGIHILDAFERFIMFCAVTEEPLETFRLFMQNKLAAEVTADENE